MLKIADLTDKELGVVFTPLKTAEYIISRIGPISQDDVILDPCVGTGVFVEALLKSGVSRNQIVSFDINPNYKDKIENLGIEFRALDTLLRITPEDHNKFNFIVGNPPYLNKASIYIKTKRKELKLLYGKINAHETYSMFIVNSIWRLKEGGKLGFITSDSFLSLSTHTRLRKFLLKTCIINEILLAPKNLFSRQSVNTNPAILILTKCSGQKNYENRKKNVIRVISRVKVEEDYWNPKKVNNIEQSKYNLLPFNIFFTDIEDGIIELFAHAPKLEKYLQGYIGMHTHNNQKFIAALENTELAETFKKRNNKIDSPDKKFKIITTKDLDFINWKPYLKRGGADQYYRPIIEAIDWKEDSRKNYDIPRNVPFEREGIIISGVSSRLAARHMPKGCYWDSNKAIGFLVKTNTISIFYFLGLLNSSFYNFLAKGIINNTYSIQITGIHALPFIPPDKETMNNVEILAKEIIIKKQQDKDYGYSKEQQQIDELIFKLYSKKYNLSNNFNQILKRKYSIYKNS